MASLSAVYALFNLLIFISCAIPRTASVGWSAVVTIYSLIVGTLFLIFYILKMIFIESTHDGDEADHVWTSLREALHLFREEVDIARAASKGNNPPSSCIYTYQGLLRNSLTRCNCYSNGRCILVPLGSSNVRAIYS